MALSIVTGLISNPYVQLSVSTSLFSSEYVSLLMNANRNAAAKTASCFGLFSYSVFKALFNPYPEKRDRTLNEALTEYELEVKNLLGEEALRFDPQDPRNKTLILSADKTTDHNNALKLSNDTKLLESLNQKFDLKYKTIYEPLDVCWEIEKGNEQGRLIGILFKAHGSEASLRLSKKSIGLSPYQFPSDCFKGLPAEAKIAISACNSGSLLVEENIAQHVADVSQRPVMASELSTSWSRTHDLSTPEELNLQFFWSPPENWADYKNRLGKPDEDGLVDATRLFHPRKFELPFPYFPVDQYFFFFVDRAIECLTAWELGKLSIWAKKKFNAYRSRPSHKTEDFASFQQLSNQLQPVDVASIPWAFNKKFRIQAPIHEACKIQRRSRFDSDF